MPGIVAILTKPRALIALLFLAGAFFGHNFLDFLGRNRVDLVVDATISEGNQFEVYINKDWWSPSRQPIRPGTRFTYVFRNVPGNITYLRLDPTDADHAKVEIYGAEFRQNGVTLLKLTPQELGGWMYANLRFTAPDATGVLKFTSTSSDPQIARDPFMFTAAAAGWLKSAVDVLAKWRYSLGCWTLVFVLAAYELLLNPRSHPARSVFLAVTMAAALACARLFCAATLRLGGNLPSVARAVGNASFTGLAKGAEIRAAWAAVLGGTLVVVLGGLAWKWLEPRLAARPAPTPEPPPAVGASWIAFAVLAVALFALLIFPPLRTILASAAQTAHPPSYDGENFTTWAYFRHLRLVPFKDFWFPYSGLYYCIFVPFPPDILFLWLHRVLLFAVSAVSCHRLYNRGVRWTVLTLLAVAWMLTGLLEATDRYLICASVVLSFAVCLETNAGRACLLWGAYAFYAFFMEGSQIIYAAPACFVLLLARLRLAAAWPERLALLDRVARGTGVAVALAGTYLLYLYQRGALVEFIEFYRTLGIMADYTMYPAAILDWFRQPFAAEGILWLSTILLVFGAVWIVASSRSSRLSFQDHLPLALAVLSLMVLQKQIIRPHVALQLLAVPVVGWTFLAARVTPAGMRGGLGAQLAAGFLSGFVVFLFFGDAGAAWRSDLAEISLVPGNARLALSDRDQWTRAESNYFAPATFPLDGISGLEIRNQLLKKMTLGKPDDLYVLGDDSYLYVLLGQTPPFYITFYNQSMLSSQQTTVAWLDRHQPKYVLWRDSFKAFDAVPNVVRVPLVFSRVIRDYSYMDRAGEFLILQRKPPVQPAGLDFWRSHLGPTLDLGFIPSRSQPAGGDANAAAGGVDFAVAEVPQPVQGRERTLSFDLDGAVYRLQFRERARINTYHIRLDRVWFWQAARRDGLPVKMRPAEGNDWTLSHRNLTLTGDTLY